MVGTGMEGGPLMTFGSWRGTAAGAGTAGMGLGTAGACATSVGPCANTTTSTERISGEGMDRKVFTGSYYFFLGIVLVGAGPLD